MLKFNDEGAVKTRDCMDIKCDLPRVTGQEQFLKDEQRCNSKLALGVGFVHDVTMTGAGQAVMAMLSVGGYEVPNNSFNLQNQLWSKLLKDNPHMLWSLNVGVEVYAETAWYDELMNIAEECGARVREMETQQFKSHRFIVMSYCDIMKIYDVVYNKAQSEMSWKTFKELLDSLELARLYKKVVKKSTCNWSEYAAKLPWATRDNYSSDEECVKANAIAFQMMGYEVTDTGVELRGDVL